MVNLNVFERIRQAAEQGDAFAQFELALALDFGNGGEQDFDKAAVWSFDTNHGRLSLATTRRFLTEGPSANRAFPIAIIPVSIPPSEQVIVLSCWFLDCTTGGNVQLVP